MILDGQGRLIWFHQVPNRGVFNLKVRRYRGKPVLTWWQGKIVDGHGARGADVIMDSSYQPVAVLHAGFGYSSDLHEFEVTPQGRALIDAYVPVQTSSGTVLDCVIQELDIRTGRVLWEWHAMGHVPLSASYVGPPSGRPWDYFHINSIQQLANGKLLISARNTWAVYMIDQHTGQVDWTLGGKNSNFSLGSGANFEWQHDAVLHRNGLLTLFDDAGLPQEESQSSAKELRVNTGARTVSLVARFTHSPPLITGAEGSMELFADHKVFVGWGSTQQFSEYSASRHQIFNGSFIAPVNTYRAYRFIWSGHPKTRGALAVSPGPNGGVAVYASWNGATNVAAWRVLGGRTPKTLTPIGNAKKSGFETAIHVHSEPQYFAVQALDGGGHVLRQTVAIRTPSHIDLYGQRAFVSSSTGRGTLPVACFPRGSKSCTLQATVSTHGHALAASPHQRFPAGQGGLVHFTLSASGRHQLRESGSKGLPVDVRLRSASGRVATVRLRLVSFSTSGRGPKRSLSQSRKVQLVGTTDFASGSGHGAILAACYSQSPCPIRASVSVAGAPIATTKLQTLGAEELGYLNFQLNPAGRSMLKHAPGNQLGVQVRLRSAQGVASGQVALVRYS
jgi:Arylsulfotransferase (ASST)